MELRKINILRAENDQGGRFEKGHHVRRRKENPSQDHDGERNSSGPYPDHIQPRHRRRRHEADCRAHGWRCDNIDNSRIDYLSRNLYDLEEQGFSERLKAWPNEYSLLCCKWSLPTTAQ
jgi:hypothetical protein